MTHLKKLLSFLGFWSFHLLLLVLIPFSTLSCFATNLYTCVVQALRWTGWDIGRMWDIFIDSFQRGVK